MRKVTEDFIGTCQACFGEFKVNETSKLIVLHGYKRPGDGYTHGECAGTGHAPFEYDTALTVQIIAMHRDLSDKAAQRFAKLIQWQTMIQTGEAEGNEAIKLTRHYREYNKETHRYDDKSEIVTPGHAYWDNTLRTVKARTISDENYHTRVAAYLQAKVDAWQRGQIVGIDVPVTGLTRAFRKAYDPAEEDAQKERDRLKAERDAKPGKLKVMFHRKRGWPEDGLSDTDRRRWFEKEDAEEKALVARIKAWTKANLTEHTEGKVIVRAELGDYDLPRSIRNDGERKVVTVIMPWYYRDLIDNLFSNAVPYETEKKKRSFTIEGEPS